MSIFSFSLRPKDRKFSVLFEQGALNAIKTAHELRDLVCIWETVKERVGVMKDLEQEGDAITHQIMALLHRTFVTPFDREDISLLAESLDDVTDCIHAAADAMLLYNVERPPARAREIAGVIVQAAEEMGAAVSDIGNRIDQAKLLKHCVEINRIENVGDSLYRAALAELFAESTDTASLIKWREIYQHMEDAIDHCEDVANVLEGIALKYA